MLARPLPTACRAVASMSQQLHDRSLLSPGPDSSTGSDLASLLTAYRASVAASKQLARPFCVCMCQLAIALCRPGGLLSLHGVGIHEQAICRIFLLCPQSSAVWAQHPPI